MSLKWRKNQQVSSGRLLLSRTRLLADINHLCKSRFLKNERNSEKLFFSTSFLEQIHYGKNLGRTMVFLNKKRNGFMKRNVLVIVSQQSSSMRTIKNKPRWRFSTPTFFSSNYVLIIINECPSLSCCQLFQELAQQFWLNFQGIIFLAWLRF